MWGEPFTNQHHRASYAVQSFVDSDVLFLQECVTADMQDVFGTILASKGFHVHFPKAKRGNVNWAVAVTPSIACMYVRMDVRTGRRSVLQPKRTLDRELSLDRH